MILVTSANGHTGQSIIRQLVKQGLDVRATDISPATAELKQQLGVKETIVGDLTNLATIREAIKGVDQVVYIPPLFIAEEALVGKYLIDECVKQHVNQFVMVSVTHPIMSTLLQHTAKREVEEYLMYQELEHHFNYTILQPMHYMHNFDPKTVHETGVYSIFYDINTRLSYVDSDDVGEVLAKVLADPAHHNRATYELVGPDFLSPSELALQYNEVTGENAVAKEVNLEEFLDAAGFMNVYSRDAVIHLAHTYSKWGLAGKWLLGRKPTTFKQYVAEKVNQ
ncbi:SDR family oxidoreductase [Paucilactobacillus kaifaensis]|uniref:SDR family oxidoreductase n=1 Tax=Paucilactobacillus kaifaensis TaxID=2559921 RepID=UPI0010F43BFB|nr:NmrA family NAD(P)-binding protein [Paucilactobacillus kaifaensis]